MTFFHAIILSIVEGITEFLPISSTGHLILTTKLLGIEQTEFTKSFEIIIQLGAILAVIVLYSRKIVSNIQLLKKVLIAFLPTAVISFFLYRAIKDVLLENEYIILASFFIGGIILILFDQWYKRQKNKTLNTEALTFPKSAVIGLVQTLAVIPGVSRSAATIVGGMSLGLDKKSAVEFSFLLAIPTMLAASGYDLLKTQGSFSANEYQLLAVGFIGAFITALAAIKLFLGFVQKHSFTVFGVYRILLSMIYWLIMMR